MKKGEIMPYSCPQCRMEKGMDCLLVKAASGNELVCRINQEHKFVVDREGFLVSSKGSK